MIQFYFENIDNQFVNTKMIIKWIKLLIKKHNFKLGDINYIFCDDEYILKINKEFLNHDYYTDIITFDYVNNNIINGDIFISITTVESNSIQFSTTFQEELNRVISHGILHLIGFKDKTEEEQDLMTKMENDALYLLKTIS